MDFNSLYSDKYFDSQLEKFNNRHNNHWMPRINKNFEMLDELGVKNGRVLDLGCSIGTYAYEFADRGFEATGIDLSGKAIRIADDIARKNGKNIKYVVGDVSERNNFGENEFDLIYAGDIIEHLVPEILSKTISNCYYWLKPKGYFIFHTVPTKYNVLFHWKFFWILLVPFIILPDNLFKIIARVYYWKLNIIIKVFTGMSLKERERKSVHCNLQTKESLTRIIRDNGFKIVNIELAITEPRYLIQIKAKIFKNKEYFKKDIFGIAIKNSC